MLQGFKSAAKKIIISTLFITPLLSQADPTNTSSTNIFSDQALDLKESQLKTIAKNLDSYKFSLLKAGNTTPDAWVVKDNQGKNLALLKCTSGNNYARAEIAAYYIGRHLNFPIYPVTVAANIQAPLTQQLNISPQVCALKEWVTNFAMLYWKAQANVPKIIAQGQYNTYQQKNTFISGSGFKRQIADTIMCNNDLNTLNDVNIQLSTGSRIRNGDPKINNAPTLFTSNDVSLLEIATQLSNIMLLDAIFENGDRFPGGNLEFRSKIDKVEIIKNRHQVVILNPQLSSLDTGLAFKGWHNTWGRLEMQYYLRRFDPVMIEKLKKLLDELDHLTSSDLKEQWSYLDFNTQKNTKITAVNYLKENIRWALKFVEDEKKNKIKSVIPNQNSACKQIFYQEK